jgi:hypothetical protein
MDNEVITYICPQCGWETDMTEKNARNHYFIRCPACHSTLDTGFPSPSYQPAFDIGSREELAENIVDAKIGLEK